MWKVSKYGVISGPYFPVFGLNMKIYGVNLSIQSEYRKIRTRNNSIFGHFSCSDRYLHEMLYQLYFSVLFKLILASHFCFSLKLQLLSVFIIFSKNVKNSNGLVVGVMDFQSTGTAGSKPLGGSKVDSTFYPSEVDQMSTKNSWGLSGKK